jgi:hypothetical protein
VTLNSGSNTLTLLSDITSAIPATFTFASGGTDPVSAFAFSSGNGFDDLVVANNGDGALALFEGGPNGLSLASTLFEPDLPSPTALAFSGMTGGEVEFYAATEGREAAILVALSLGGSITPSGPGETPGPLPVPASEAGVAQLVAIDDSSLALVGSLLIVTVATPSGESGAGLPEIAAANVGAPAGLGQSASLLAPEVSDALDDPGNTLGQGLLEEAPIARGKMTWERFVLGTDEAIERFTRQDKDKATTDQKPPPAPKPIENQDRREEDKPEGQSGDAASDALALAAPDRVFSRCQNNRAAAIDEAIDCLCNDESFAIARGVDYYVTLRSGGMTPKFAHKSTSRRAIGNAAAAPQLVLGALLGGWAFSGPASRWTQTRLSRRRAR